MEGRASQLRRRASPLLPGDTSGRALDPWLGWDAVTQGSAFCLPSHTKATKTPAILADPSKQRAHKGRERILEMKILIPRDVIAATTSEVFAHERSHIERTPNGFREIEVDVSEISAGDLAEVKQSAADLGETRCLRALDALTSPADGDWKVPNFKAFLPLLRDFLKTNKRKGWLWEEQRDGSMLPWAIVSARLVLPDHPGRNNPYVLLVGQAYSASDKKEMRIIQRSWHFQAGEASRRTVRNILAQAHLHPETEELEVGHEAAIETWRQAVDTGFAEQYRVTGAVHKYDGYSSDRDPDEPIGRKVIFDLESKMMLPFPEETESSAFGNEKNTTPVENPIHPLTRVFDLATHDGYWISTRHLDRHEYDMALRDKLVLPASHRDLLDVLTSDISIFADDFIEGKSSGNLILAKGLPGLGKTLTAEVYAELMKRPLYSVHAGVLGTDPGEIESRLRTVFMRAKRWNCVLLLDEADVFVMQRSNDVQLNAIVAEFLRALEHFDGLIFMTTNRPGDIDEAIISRCAAIIHYTSPSPEDARRIWTNISENFGAALDAELIEALVTDWPSATGRDINRLLRLALRVAKSEDKPIDRDIIRRCAVFRGMAAPQQA